MYDPILISVVMPAFNAEKTIGPAIESVVNQTYEKWELLVIDDGSKDSTCDIVKSFQRKDQRVVLHALHRNLGLSNARNEGCRIAKGDFIAFLDSDDLWTHEKLKMQVDFHNMNPDIMISHTDFLFFNESGIIKKPFRPFANFGRKAGKLYPDICYQNSIGVLTVLAKKEILSDINYFDTSLWTMEDQDLWVRIARAGYQFGYLPEVLAQYRVSTGGISAKTGKYKRAYKAYIKKQIKADGTLNRSEMWRIYYRYFGAIYFNKNEFALARLYLNKSIATRPFYYSNIITIFYLLYVLVKSSIGYQQNNGR